MKDGVLKNVAGGAMTVAEIAAPLGPVGALKAGSTAVSGTKAIVGAGVKTAKTGAKLTSKGAKGLVTTAKTGGKNVVAKTKDVVAKGKEKLLGKASTTSGLPGGRKILDAVGKSGRKTFGPGGAVPKKTGALYTPQSGARTGGFMQKVFGTKAAISGKVAQRAGQMGVGNLSKTGKTLDIGRVGGLWGRGSGGRAALNFAGGAGRKSVQKVQKLGRRAVRRGAGGGGKAGGKMDGAKVELFRQLRQMGVPIKEALKQSGASAAMVKASGRASAAGLKAGGKGVIKAGGKGVIKAGGEVAKKGLIRRGAGLVGKTVAGGAVAAAGGMAMIEGGRQAMLGSMDLDYGEEGGAIGPPEGPLSDRVTASDDRGGSGAFGSSVHIESGAMARVANRNQRGGGATAATAAQYVPGGGPGGGGGYSSERHAAGLEVQRQMESSAKHRRGGGGIDYSHPAQQKRFAGAIAKRKEVMSGKLDHLKSAGIDTRTMKGEDVSRKSRGMERKRKKEMRDNKATVGAEDTAQMERLFGDPGTLGMAGQEKNLKKSQDRMSQQAAEMRKAGIDVSDIEDKKSFNKKYSEFSAKQKDEWYAKQGRPGGGGMMGDMIAGVGGAMRDPMGALGGAVTSAGQMFGIEDPMGMAQQAMQDPMGAAKQGLSALGIPGFGGGPSGGGPSSVADAIAGAKQGPLSTLGGGAESQSLGLGGAMMSSNSQLAQAMDMGMSGEAGMMMMGGAPAGPAGGDATQQIVKAIQEGLAGAGGAAEGSPGIQIAEEQIAALQEAMGIDTEPFSNLSNGLEAFTADELIQSLENFNEQFGGGGTIQHELKTDGLSVNINGLDAIQGDFEKRVMENVLAEIERKQKDLTNGKPA